jgi:hypothetical protein
VQHLDHGRRLGAVAGDRGAGQRSGAWCDALQSRRLHTGKSSASADDGGGRRSSPFAATSRRGAPRGQARQQPGSGPAALLLPLLRIRRPRRKPSACEQQRMAGLSLLRTFKDIAIGCLLLISMSCQSDPKH